MGSAEKKGTIKAILIMVFSMLMSRGLGYIRTAAIAGTAGTQGGADAYAFSFLLPDLLNQILAGGALSVTFIPLFQSLSDDPKAQNRFFSNLFWIGSAIFGIGVIVSYALTPFLIRKLAGETINNSDTFILTVKLTRIILPAQLFFFWGALLNGAQYAKKKFFLPSLTPVIYNLGIIIGGISLYNFIGIEGFTWGVVTGAFIGNVVVQAFGAFSMGTRLSLTFDYKDKLIKEWFFKTFPLIFTIGLANANEMMLRLFGSRIPGGEGAISALTYAYRTYMIFVGLFGQAFAAAIYPFLSQIASDNSQPLKIRLKEMETSLFTTLQKTAVFTILGATIMYTIRYDLIALLYQRGAFTIESTLLTAKAFSAYLPGMFFLSASLLILRLFFSLKQTYTTLVISLISLGVTIPLYALGTKYGVIGIGISGSTAAIVTFTLLLFRWKQIYNDSQMMPFLRKVLHIGIVALVAGSFSLIIKQLLPEQTNIQWKIFRILLQSIPTMGLALLYFDRRGLLSLKSILRRRG